MYNCIFNNGPYEQLEDAMTEKKQKKKEQPNNPKKSASSETEFITVSVSPDFPFRDLCCHKEHKEIFEGLFAEDKS
ncbi:unnamed protein product [marine sediment metagenome]|uniref:Uncharacterized protein n=1 Tax=marine sediment metagenome TaxID=412755 RepID=X0UGR0_9ZZZZ